MDVKLNEVGAGKEASQTPVVDGDNIPDPQKPTIIVTKRHDRSAFMWLLHTLIRPIRSKLTHAKEELPAGSPRLTPHSRAKSTCHVHERKVEDIYLYDILPKRPKPAEQVSGEKSARRRKRRIFYYAGGGWQMPASSDHWYLVAQLALKLHAHGYAVTLVSYPLAPNSPAPTSFPMLMTQYRSLLRTASEDDDEDVILAGDSAGGNLAVCLLIAALLEDETEGLRRPTCTAVMLISPSTDLRRRNPDMDAVSKKDPILTIRFVRETATKWRGTWDAGDARVSPLLADLQWIQKRGVKVHGVTGRYDILGPDALLFREKCSQARIHGEWLDWDKQMHVFPMVAWYGLKEGREGLGWILNVLRRT